MDKAVAAEVIHKSHETHIHKDPVGSKIGMWLFLLTELLLFGGMFIIYGVYRYMNSESFHNAAMELDVALGALNTIILLTSSLTAALSISALQKGNKPLSQILIVVTLLFAFGFLVNKFFEWSAKFHHGIFPGGEDLASRPNGEILFFGLYYVMTGIHGLHIIIGIVFFLFVLVQISKNKITATDYTKLENAGLYWHLVDIIWIFLFPLFYLMR